MSKYWYFAANLLPLRSHSYRFQVASQPAGLNISVGLFFIRNGWRARYKPVRYDCHSVPGDVIVLGNETKNLG